jgi:hypothetical protein
MTGACSQAGHGPVRVLERGIKGGVRDRPGSPVSGVGGIPDPQDYQVNYPKSGEKMVSHFGTISGGVVQTGTGQTYHRLPRV